MDWTSWQDVIEEELDEAAEEGRPPPSEDELLRKAGIATLEDAAQSIPQLKELLAKRASLEQKMSRLLGGAPASSDDPRFDQMFGAPIPEDPVRPTRRVQPMKLEPRPLRERIREEREDRARRERLQGAALERRDARLDFEKTITEVREGRLQERVKKRLKDRVRERAAERLTQVLKIDDQGRAPFAKGPAAKGPAAKGPAGNSAAMTLSAIDRRKASERLSSPLAMVMGGREGVQRKLEREVLPVLKRRVMGAANGKSRLLVRSPEAPTDKQLDDKRRRQRERAMARKEEEDRLLTARERQQQRLEKLREDAARRREEVEEDHKNVESIRERVQKRREAVEDKRKDVDNLRREVGRRHEDASDRTSLDRIRARRRS